MMYPFHHLTYILFYFSTSVLSTHPVLDIPLLQSNALKPSFTITEVLDLNGGATLMPMPNTPTTTPIDPLLTISTTTILSSAGEIAQNPNAKPLHAGEIANRPNLKDQVLNPEALENLKSTCSPSFLNDAEFKKAVLNSTNTIRKIHLAPALTWNETLATYATNYSTLCHTRSSHSSFGENIASSKENVISAIESWNLKLPTLQLTLSNLTALEKDLTPKKLAKSLQKAKAFTQLVWKNTTSLGCGRTLCGGSGGGQNGIHGWLVVCEFNPKGNIVGQFGANVQQATDTSSSSSSSSTSGIGAGQIAADRSRPDAGAIGKAENSGTVDRVQVWCVFIVVWLVFGAVFS
jgi:Cysteine-rich secretory protein family